MPARRGTTDLTLLIAGALLIASVAAVAAVLSPPQHAPQQDGSSYASHASGAKAAYLLLRDLGVDVQRSLEPFATLRVDPSNTLAVLADPLQPPSQSDLTALNAFVEAGGVLVAAGSSAVAFLPGLTEGPARTEADLVPVTYRAAVPSPLTRDTPTVRLLPGPRHVRVDADIWMPIYGTVDDPAVLRTRRGAGRIVWLTSAHPLSNAGIAEAGHLELLLNAVGLPSRRQVLWDEHYHGHARSLWSYAQRTPVAWGLFQLAVIGAAVLFTAGRRVGPPRSRAADPRTSPLEFIDTVGALYERARPAAAAVAVARARMRRLLQMRSGLSAAASDDRIVNAAGRLGLDPEAVEALLADSAAAARNPHTAEWNAVPLVARLQRAAAQAAEFGSSGTRQQARSHDDEHARTGGFADPTGSR